MKTKTIDLPQGYISYSQLMLWQNDRKKYEQTYFDRRDELRSFSNKGQEYGKLVADALEMAVETGDLLTDAAMLMLPKYDVADQEIHAELKTKDGVVPVIGKPDSMDSETKRFYEFKTGKVPWTKSKAQNHPQMRFYAMVIYLKYGVVLKDAELVWIQTVYDEDKKQTMPTGHIERFLVTFTTKDLYDTMATVSRAANEIAVAWAAHVPDKRLVW